MQRSLTDFYRPYIPTLYDDADFRTQVLGLQILEESSILQMQHSISPDRELFDRAFLALLEEAELTLSLAHSLGFTRRDRLLEVGGGLGLVYGFLRHAGYDVWSIEPSDAGFSGFYPAAMRLFAIVGIDPSGFRPLTAARTGELGVAFDYIFSNNVLEHVIELEASLVALSRALTPDGRMLHNTVNYEVPYEPHFKMPLVPGFPRATALFRPSLKQSALWNGLHFVTAGEIRGICARHDLRVAFHRDRTRATFERLGSDRQFAKRHRLFIPLYTLMTRLRLLHLLDALPIALTTPMTFTISRSRRAERGA